MRFHSKICVLRREWPWVPRLWRPSAPSYKRPYSPSPLRALVSSEYSNKHHKHHHHISDYKAASSSWLPVPSQLLVIALHSDILRNYVLHFSGLRGIRVHMYNNSPRANTSLAYSPMSFLNVTWLASLTSIDFSRSTDSNALAGLAIQPSFLSATCNSLINCMLCSTCTLLALFSSSC